LGTSLVGDRIGKKKGKIGSTARKKLKIGWGERINLSVYPVAGKSNIEERWAKPWDKKKHQMQAGCILDYQKNAYVFIALSS